MCDCHWRYARHDDLCDCWCHRHRPPLTGGTRAGKTTLLLELLEAEAARVEHPKGVVPGEVLARHDVRI